MKLRYEFMITVDNTRLIQNFFFRKKCPKNNLSPSDMELCALFPERITWAVAFSNQPSGGILLKRGVCHRNFGFCVTNSQNLLTFRSWQSFQLSDSIFLILLLDNGIYRSSQMSIGPFSALEFASSKFNSINVAKSEIVVFNYSIR